MTGRSATTSAARALTRRLADESATEELGARLAALARPGDAILLSGPYGSGKTALARAFLRAAAGDPALVVPSPSFTLLQAYALPSGVTVSHYDLWRLAAPEEIGELGWAEAQEGIVLVEWPERLGDGQPEAALHVALAPVPGQPQARDVTMRGWGCRLEGLG